MNLPSLINHLSHEVAHFVKISCVGRDASHGFEHAQAVVRNAVVIAGALPDMSIDDMRIIILAAWLHDVADHKYDQDGTLKKNVEKFLLKHAPQDYQLILNIIDRVSYSKEVKARSQATIDWHIVLGDRGMRLRDIVSDADKLEALGRQGLERCKLYAQHYYAEKYGKEITPELLSKYVHDHAEEKLLRLKDHFIRTEPGKRLAEPLHGELIEALAELLPLEEKIQFHAAESREPNDVFLP